MNYCFEGDDSVNGDDLVRVLPKDFVASVVGSGFMRGTKDLAGAIFQGVFVELGCAFHR